MVTLEWTLLNSQNYYQQLLSNVSISADPQPENVMFTGDMRVQLELSYNTLYNVSVTKHSTCRQLVGTTFIELTYSKLLNNIIMPIMINFEFHDNIPQASVAIQ